MLRSFQYCRTITRNLKNWVPEIMPRLVDQSGEMTFDGSFWKKNVSISAAVASFRPKNAKQQRVSILTENNRNFLSSIFATWISGASAVPLSPLHPLPQLQYYIEDSQSQVIITDKKNLTIAEQLRASSEKTKSVGIIVADDCPLVSAAEFFAKNAKQMFNVGENSECIILYTSGTTGRPKGVSLTMTNLSTQVQAQAKAWDWSFNDVVLHTLPLYHTHGLVNAFLTPLFHGATVIMRPRFNEDEVAKYLMGDIKTSRGPVSVFTGVPTMYSKLLDHIKKNSPGHVKERFRNIRLMMSGSAPLSESLAKEWTGTTGIELLERYGATESGMILTNPLKGQRSVGYVGMPFNSVTVRLVNSKTGHVCLTATSSGVNNVASEEIDDFAELQVSGPSIFSHYINREKETAAVFAVDQDGTKWYKTGDCVSYNPSLNSFKINGRLSADIIKSGGYKISALDVETKLGEHPSIKECAVLGVPDQKWGERIVVVMQLRDNSHKSHFTLDNLRAWCKPRMPAYWTPTEMLFVDDGVPRNNMGKVNKKELRKLFLKT